MIKKITVLIISIIFTATGCSSTIYDNENSLANIKPIEEDDTAKEIPIETPEEETEEVILPTIDSTKYEELINQPLSAEEQVNELINAMSLEEKIAQLFIVDFYAMTGQYHQQNYTDDMHIFLSKYPVGGVIYFAENVDSAEQVISLNSTLQENSPIPLYIAVDEEGGIVSRLGAADIGVDHLPNAATLALEYEPEEMTNLATRLGLQLKELGFNFDFAPVMDINTNPDNTVIGSRAFGDTADMVTEYSLPFAMGLQDAGVLASAKHFPGHGDTKEDSHFETAAVSHTLERLDQVEYVPFKAAIDAGIASVMVGHITVREVTEEDLPASLSYEMITGQLRDHLGFDGIVVTDSLRMQAITDIYEPEIIGIKYIEAGGDIILMPEDFEATYNSLLGAVKEGVISEERIDESLVRILSYKLDPQYGIISQD